MIKGIKALVTGLVVLAGIQTGWTAGTGPVDTLFAISNAGSTIVNGWWDSTATTADEYGEMTLEITGVFSGIHDSLMTSAESVVIGSCYAISSMESLRTPNDTVNNTPYDTVWFKYKVQNQGNLTDSVFVEAAILDTSNTSYFKPVDFDITDGNDSNNVISYNTSEDTIRYGVRLAQEGLDSFWVRFVIPSPLYAADGDSLWFNVRMRDREGVGTWDAWPDTVPGSGWASVKRTILDTFITDHYIHLHQDGAGGDNDTLWEYGDDQNKNYFLTINSPILRLKKTVQSTGRLPGDTLTYKIFYENDGSAATEDTAIIVDVMPRGVAFLDTDTVAIDFGGAARGGGDRIAINYRYDNTWQTYLTNSVPESLLLINALRIKIPAGIGIDDTTGEAGSDDKTDIVADGDSTDADAGFVQFKVRIR